MTEKQKSEIIRMRESGASYSQIADVTGVSRNTVKSFCSRNNINMKIVSKPDDKSDCLYCKQCGAALHQIPGRKARKFCNRACRTKWWNAHPEEINKRAVYNFTCPHCHKPFTAYGNSSRKYCSHECYIADRFGKGGSNG